MSDANATLLRYRKETTFGTAASGQYQVLRTTGDNLVPGVQYTQSQEIRSDGQVGDFVLTDVNANGPINIEMSYGTFDDFILAALRDDAWSSTVTVTATDISAAASDNSFNSAGSGFGSLAVNQWVKTTGFSNAANNGVFKILTKTSSKITVAGGTLVNESSGSSFTILQGAATENGTTKTSFSIEREYTDVSSTFEQFLGMSLNTLSLEVAAGQIMTGSLGFIGKKGQSGTSTLAASDASATTVDVLNAITNITSIWEGGYGSASALSAISLGINITNNIRARKNLGDLGASSVGYGQIGVTGTLRAYFESATMFNKYLNGTATSLAFVLTDSAGSKYVIDIPQVKFTSGSRAPGGINQDIEMNLEWGAYRDPTEGKTIRVVRFA